MDEKNQNNYDALKAELDLIREDYNRASRLLKNINEFAEQFTELKNKLNDSEDGVATNYDWIKSKKSEIEDTANKANVFLAKIESNLSKVKENIETMQKSYEEFAELKGKVSGRGQEIETLTTTAISLKADIERTKSEAQKLLESISAALEKAKAQIENMQTAYQDFLAIQKKIEDPDDGIEAIIDIVQNLEKQARALHEEIKSFRDQSKQMMNDIQKNKTESDKVKDQILKTLEIAEARKSDVEKVTSLITDTGFANAFQKRAKKLFWSYMVWIGILMVSIIAFTISLYVYLYEPGTGIPSIENTIYRLSLTSPLWLLIGFAMRQYGKERELNEKYEFRAVAASTVRTHIESLLKDVCKPDEISNFANTVFLMLYKEPYDYDDFSSKIEKLEKEIRILKKEEGLLDVKEITSSVKELKSLINDESVLEKIISLFVKSRK